MSHFETHFFGLCIRATLSFAGGILTGDEIGTIKGGYVAQITGPLDVSDPANWPLVGKVDGGNAVDYQCVINPDGTLQNNPCTGGKCSGSHSTAKDTYHLPVLLL